ncbi:MAG: hypothetical protein CM1200mP20_12320 [Pseudomonadota bacterium]|nr:MAG: hypothetical protein CM1200mP20_12320 [Pseudomonadota bacterium]
MRWLQGLQARMPHGRGMARMKMELQAMRARKVGLTAGQRLVLTCRAMPHCWRPSQDC